MRSAVTYISKIERIVFKCVFIQLKIYSKIYAVTNSPETNQTEDTQ